MRIFLVFLFISLFVEISAQTKTKEVIYEELDSAGQARLDSIIFSKIPYDSLLAFDDIKSGNIKLVFGCGDPMLSNEEFKFIEKQFGFRFVSDCNEIPEKYRRQRRNEYNKIVYRYLDSLNNLDTEKAIHDELFRLLIERELISKKTDKEFLKIIRKCLKGESKEIKKQVYQADLLYRDRKFKEALKLYSAIVSENERTNRYLINSKYHCLMNLKQFEKARSLYRNNKESINRTNKINNR